MNSSDNLQQNTQGIAISVSGFMTGSVGREFGYTPERADIGALQEVWLNGFPYQRETIAYDQHEIAIEKILTYLESHPDGKIVLVGHSWGGDTVIEIAELLNQMGIKVDLVMQLDSVGYGDEAKPGNVLQAVNIYSTDMDLINGATQVDGAINYGIENTSHTEIDKDATAIALIREYIEQLFPQLPAIDAQTILNIWDNVPQPSMFDPQNVQPNPFQPDIAVIDSNDFEEIPSPTSSFIESDQLPGSSIPSLGGIESDQLPTLFTPRESLEPIELPSIFTPRGSLESIEPDFGATPPIEIDQPSIFDRPPMETESIQTPSVFNFPDESVSSPVFSTPGTEIDASHPSSIFTLPNESEQPSIFNIPSIQPEPIETNSIFQPEPIETNSIFNPSTIQTDPSPQNSLFPSSSEIEQPSIFSITTIEPDPLQAQSIFNPPTIEPETMPISSTVISPYEAEAQSISIAIQQPEPEFVQSSTIFNPEGDKEPIQIPSIFNPTTIETEQIPLSGFSGEIEPTTIFISTSEPIWEPPAYLEPQITQPNPIEAVYSPDPYADPYICYLPPEETNPDFSTGSFSTAPPDETDSNQHSSMFGSSTIGTESIGDSGSTSGSSSTSISSSDPTE